MTEKTTVDEPKFINTIKKYKPKDHKIKALVYGASWSGKTVFASTAKKPLFLSAEAGLLSIQKDVDMIEIKCMADLENAFRLIKNWVDYDTIVLDSISEINEIIKADIERKNWKPMQIQDWGVLSKKIRWLLKWFRDLDYHVVMIAQEDEQKDDEKIHKIVPMLNWKSATTIAYFMDVVAYISIQTDWSRLIQTLPDPKLMTKDRTNKIGNGTQTFVEWVELLSNLNEKKPETIKQPTEKKEAKK